MTQEKLSNLLMINVAATNKESYLNNRFIHLLTVIMELIPYP